MPDPQLCADCPRPAVIRFAYALPAESVVDALGARAQYRCEEHSPGRPGFLAFISPRYLVIDPAFTAVMRGPLCDCGVPLAEHAGATRRACARAAR